MTVPTPAAQRYAEGLTEKFADDPIPAFRDAFRAHGMRLRDKIIALNPDGSDRSAHAFVDRETGAVYKAESWNRPAPYARYACVEDAIAAADPAGGYLYIR